MAEIAGSHAAAGKCRRWRVRGFGRGHAVGGLDVAGDFLCDGGGVGFWVRRLYYSLDQHSEREDGLRSGKQEIEDRK